jgi:hypothetical protein
MTGQQADHHPVGLHRAGPGRFQLDMPDETDYGRIGIDNNIVNRCFFIGLQGPPPRSHGNSQPSPPTRRHSEALEPSELVQRLGSGDGESKTLLTRQMPYEPLPASVLFAPLLSCGVDLMDCRFPLHCGVLTIDDNRYEHPRQMLRWRHHRISHCSRRSSARRTDHRKRNMSQ